MEDFANITWTDIHDALAAVESENNSELTNSLKGSLLQENPWLYSYIQRERFMTAGKPKPDYEYVHGAGV